MTLNEKQTFFTDQIARFICDCFDHGYPVILAEAYRPPELAALYAEQGRGIRNSNHTRKLAVDLFRVVDGRVTWDLEAYEPIGELWKACHPQLARWGGDFTNRDSVHFSFEHNGVK